MKKQTPFLLAAIIIWAVSFLNSANATQRTFQFEGTITVSATTGVSVGDHFVATLSYDDAQTPSGTVSASYTNFTYEIDVSGMTFGISSGAQLIVVNDDAGTDHFYITGASPFSTFNLYDPTGTAFNSTALPSTLSLADFTNPIVQWNNSPDWFYGTITSITAIISQQDAIENLIDLVVSMNLNKGLTNALTTKLNEALDSLNSGDNAGAVDALNSFINNVEAQAGKKLTNEQASLLITSAQQIIDAINSASLSKKSAETITQNSVPLSYNLAQNYPNPFNPTTQIRFAIPKAGNVTLKIYNSLGQLVRTLVNGNMSEGYHQVTWDATDNSGSKLSSGVYFYRMTAGNFTQVNKMMLLK